VRGDDLGADMSRYLVRRIQDSPHIEVLLNSEIVAMHGNGALDAIEIRDRRTGTHHSIDTCIVFSMIGAVPRTEWVPPEIDRDVKGFIKTGTELAREHGPRSLLETSVPGVFAAGDVRAGSSKRVAAAVGEGAMAVQLIHAYLNA
jgi:thioredoxin reductase (NADPH)